MPYHAYVKWGAYTTGGHVKPYKEIRDITKTHESTGQIGIKKFLTTLF